MPDKDVSINFLGNSSGLIGAINQSVSAMSRMEASSKGFAGSIANFAVKQVAPILAAVGAAFAANKALSDYSNSTLPGAKAYKATIDATKQSLTALSEVIGEFLAPAAMFVSKWIKYIADALTPLIRQVTAFKASATDFLLKLGSNILGAFRPLLPTVYGFFDKIMALFNGPGRNWNAIFATIREAWNNTWDAILSFTAPILVRLSDLIETIASRFSVMFDLPNVAGFAEKVALLAKVIQGALVTALTAVQFAVKNWRLTFDIAVTSMQLGIEVIKNRFRDLAIYLGPIFQTMAENIAGYFMAAFDAAFLNMKNMAIKAYEMARHPVTFFGKGGDWAKMLLDIALPTNAKPNFTGKDLPLGGFVSKGSDLERLLRGLLGIQTANFADGLKSQLAKIPGMDATRIANLIAAIKGGLPSVVANPGDRIDTGVVGKNIGALAFGTAEAFKREGNTEQKTAIEVAKEQLKIAKQQLDAQKKAAPAVRVKL